MLLGLRGLLGSVFLNLVVLAGLGNADHEGPDRCFDDCFADMAENTEEELELEKLYELNSRMEGMRMLWGVNATAVLLDSSIHPKHGEEPDKAGIFEFERLLAAMFAYGMPASETEHPFYIVQFDGDQAWYCKAWGCLNACMASDKLVADIEDALESKDRGRIEDACYLAAKAIVNTQPCAGSPTGLDVNPMIIAITNSEFDDHILSKHHSKDSFCKRFKHRMAVATHASGTKQARSTKLVSNSMNAYFLEDTCHAKNVLRRLVQCLDESCCTGSVRKRRSLEEGGDQCERTVPGHHHRKGSSFNWNRSN